MGRKPGRDTSFSWKEHATKVLLQKCSLLSLYSTGLDVLIKFFSLFCSLIKNCVFFHWPRFSKHLQWGQVRYMRDARLFCTCMLSSAWVCQTGELHFHYCSEISHTVYTIDCHCQCYRPYALLTHDSRRTFGYYSTILFSTQNTYGLNRTYTTFC